MESIHSQHFLAFVYERSNLRHNYALPKIETRFVDFGYNVLIQVMATAPGPV